MPIYAYRCAECGHAKDVLQKLSDPVLTTCPSCGAQAFSKQVTAAGFQLKGSGWYVTDFRDGNKGAKPDAKGDAKADEPAKPGEQKDGAAKPDAPAGTPAVAPAGADTAKATPPAAAPAPTQAAAPAAPPASGST
jgi:putative FmdB family regulatory protein